MADVVTISDPIRFRMDDGVPMDNIAAALKVLKQIAVYWPLTAPTFDNYGKPITTSSPVEIKCRWDDTQDEFVDSQGMKQKASVKIIADRDLDIGGCIFLGMLDEIEDQDDPKLNPRVHEIRSFTKIADKKAKRFIRTAYL